MRCIGNRAWRCIWRGQAGAISPFFSERDLGGTALPVELHRLSPIEDDRDDIGRQVRYAQQHAKIIAAIPLTPFRASVDQSQNPAMHFSALEPGADSYLVLRAGGDIRQW